MRRVIRHTNAGHLYPYLIRAGSTLRPIESSSLPLGVREEIRPHTVEVDLCEGDTIVYLSDGIIEAQDAAGDPFGFDNLENILQGQTASTPAEIQQAILDAIDRHSGDRASVDDRTVMVLRFDRLPAQAALPVYASAVSA